MKRTLAIVMLSTILTTVGVRAADEMAPRIAFISLPSFTDLMASTLGIFKKTTAPPDGCGEDMVQVTFGEHSFCIDRYEASPSPSCVHESPRTLRESEINLLSDTCHAASISGVYPWSNISHEQATLACSRAGKTLASAFEWYVAASGTNATSCIVGASDSQRTGSAPGCISSSGAVDMVGNVWEWTFEVSDNGVLLGAPLASSGFPVLLDEAGIPRETTSVREAASSSGRLWALHTGVQGVMRGGYYRSQHDASVAALYAASPPTFSGDAVGFRCVKAL